MNRSGLCISLTAFAALSAGAPAKPPESHDLAVSRIVPAAVSIHVWAYKAGKAIPIPVTTLAGEESAKLAVLLRRGGKYHQSPPRLKGDFILRVAADKGVLNRSQAGTTFSVQYEYVSATGDLGTGTDWYTAPAPFRKRMAALRAALPRYWFTRQLRRDPTHDGTPLTFVDPRTIVDPAVLAGRRLTEPKAIAIARDFRRKLHCSSNATATAQFPAPPEIDSQPDTHWQPRWLVEFSDYVKISVVDATGVISDFDALELHSKEAISQKRLPRAELLAVARSIVKDLGPVGELMPPVIEDSGTIVNGQRDNECWVEWRRAWHGIPYRDQAVRLLLNDATGAPETMGVIFHTPPPSPVPLKVTKAAAEAAARRYVKRYNTGRPDVTASVHKATLDSTKKLIVAELPEAERPNPTRFELDVIDPGTPRVAWVCMFRFNGGFLEVWVDASTGKVIGDDFGTVRC